MTNEQPPDKEGEPMRRGRGKKPSATQGDHHDAPPSGQDPKAPRETKDERKRREREERLLPILEQLQCGSSDDFVESLNRVMNQLARQKPKAPDTAFVLEMAWKRIPGRFSGACVVKHYRTKKEWSDSERIAALTALCVAVRARDPELHELGPMLHGALIPLIPSGESAQSERRHNGASEQVAEAFVELHHALSHPNRPVLEAHPDLPNQSQFLGTLSAYLAGFRHLDGVRAIQGPRLFGFDYEFSLPIGKDGAEKPALPAALPVTSTSVSEQTAQSPLVEAARKGCPDAKLRRELEQVNRLLESTTKARDRLRAELDAERNMRGVVEQQLRESTARRENLAQLVTELQDQVEAGKLVSKELSLEQARSQALEAQIDQLEGQLRHSDEQNQKAKDAEYDRGRTAARAAISRHCMEPLEQMLRAARAIDGDAGEFMRAMLSSLTSDLKEGGH